MLFCPKTWVLRVPLHLALSDKHTSIHTKAHTILTPTNTRASIHVKSKNTSPRGENIVTAAHLETLTAQHAE